MTLMMMHDSVSLVMDVRYRQWHVQSYGKNRPSWSIGLELFD